MSAHRGCLPQQGADNVTWLWTINQDRPGTGPIASWWPGAKYVTWVGIDGCYFRPPDTFASVVGSTIGQVRALTGKPILLSEAAVGPRAGQFTKISDLFSGSTGRWAWCGSTRYRTRASIIGTGGLKTTRRRTPRSGSDSPS